MARGGRLCAWRQDSEGRLPPVLYFGVVLAGSTSALLLFIDKHMGKALKYALNANVLTSKIPEPRGSECLSSCFLLGCKAT